MPEKRRMRTRRYLPLGERYRWYARGTLRRGALCALALAICFSQQPSVDAQSPVPDCINGVCKAPHRIDNANYSIFGKFNKMNYPQPGVESLNYTQNYETTLEHLEKFIDATGTVYKEHRWSFTMGRDTGVDYIVRYPDGWTFCDSYILLPGENLWWQELRAFLYLMTLLYLFLGVAIVADVFMSAIEKITSEKPQYITKPDGTMEKVLDSDGEPVMVKTWNETVANLTLLALGSSAPEILLSLMETLGSLDQEPGELGPSTIVGSAAFNLLCISGVCMYAMPATVDGAKKIKEFGVFCITAVFSIFAYIWLLIVLQFNTPDVIDMWEAWVTLLMFPLLVVLAYMQDRKWFRGAAKVEDLTVPSKVGSDAAGELLQKEISMVAKETQLKLNGQDVDEDAIASAIADKHRPRLNRGHYRCNATRVLVAKPAIIGGHLSVPDSGPKTPPSRSQLARETGYVQFKSPTYVCSEGDGKIKIEIVRSQEACRGELYARYTTQDLTAKRGKHYVHTAGEIMFGDGEAGTKSFMVEIIDDTKQNANRTFTCKLDCSSEHAIGSISHTVVTIEDDDAPGSVTFAQPFVVVAESKQVAKVLVAREGGSCGALVVRYHTEDGEGEGEAAEDGKDYEGTQEGLLEFAQGEKSKFIHVKIMDDFDYQEKTEHFFMQLDWVQYVSGSARRPSVAQPTVQLEPKLGRIQRCRVDITNDKEHHLMVDRIKDKVKLGIDVNAKTWSGSWAQQFKDAFSIGGDEESLTPMHYVMHFLTFLWKVIFAFIPPPEYKGGWVCFTVALIFIGMLTKMVEETATLLGCSMGLKKPVTAITFVALGTSLPDTFASKQAAVEEEYADAAVGNVTGSNSVNVFLGLGLPWVVASCYYTANNTCYIIPAGDLAFSVLVFAICGTVCLVTMIALRLCHPQKAELGGPLKNVLTFFFTALWITYVLLSSLQVYHNFAGSLKVETCPSTCLDGKKPNTAIIDAWATLYPKCLGAGDVPV
eukprot:TRINITY_DN8392_c0_g1_i2.p1 TRINITY_DN8392_c0_g1~~TRINITY_DN8392_c0_g1_i2.p1  ORF type:complete len:990 (+),score=311.48 TRINITY_DN8392_c0_g1_i2:33-3002(+)